MTAWLAIGPPGNWEIALEKGIWGFSGMYGSLWRKMVGGELLFFHATRPVGGVIGYGKILSRTIQKEPFWPGEMTEFQWPLQVKFEVVLSIPKDEWTNKAIHLGKHIGFQRALQRLDEWSSEHIIQNLQKLVER